MADDSDSRSPGAVHWLVRVAERAGLSGSETLDVPPGMPAREAWPVITRAFSIPDARLAELVAEYFRLAVAKIMEADLNAVLLIPEAMARKHHIYPVLESDRHIVVATCDPTDVEAERALGFSTGRTAVFEVASPHAIQEALDARYAPERAVETLLGSLETELDEADSAVKLVEEMGPEHISADDVQATPVVKLTNLILRDGIAQSASDIHIEPGRRTGTIRYRVDGVLRKLISGVGGRRSALEMLDFCVSCVGQRRWVTTQSLAQFGSWLITGSWFSAQLHRSRASPTLSEPACASIATLP